MTELSHAARRRLHLLAEELETAPYTIEPQGTQHVVRIQLADGSKRLSMLEDAELAFLKSCVDKRVRTIESTQLGTLTRDESREGWRGSFRGIPVVVYSSDTETADEVLVVEPALVQTVLEHDRFRAAIGEHLYPTYRDNWAASADETPVERSVFEARVKLETVTVYSSDPSRVTLSWNDAGFFAGHTIQVRVEDGVARHVSL